MHYLPVSSLPSNGEPAKGVGAERQRAQLPAAHEGAEAAERVHRVTRVELSFADY